MFGGNGLRRLGKEVVDAVQALPPQHLEPVEQAVRGAEGLDVAVDALLAPLPLLHDQPGPLEHRDVLLHGGKAHGVAPSQLRHGLLVPQHERDEVAPRGVGESVDDVLGVLYLKDVIRRTQDGDPAAPAQAVAEAMRPATFVPESKPVDDLLSEMQAARTHLVIVVDEYGGTAGLVTIEDILEEIVGEITDEYDVERPPIEHLEDGAVRVAAKVPIEDLGDVFGVELPTDEVETVGGLLAQTLGRVPIPGAAVDVGGLHLVAEGTTGRRNRIDSVLVRRSETEPPAGKNDENVTETEERQPADA